MALDRNLIVILTSGHRADAYGAARAWPIQTPHLDALAAGGIDLPAVCASPASTPALLSLFSGLQPRQHAVMDDGGKLPKFGGWAKQLAESGFHVAGVGRIGMIRDHLYQGSAIADLSVTDAKSCPYLQHVSERGLLDHVVTHRQNRTRSGPFDLNGCGFDAPVDDVDGFIAEQAVMLVDQLPRDRRWVLIVSLTGPGNDLPAPRRFLEKIDPQKLMEGFVPADMRNIDRYAEPHYPRLMLQNLTPQKIATIRRHYLARVLMVDEMVGRLRRAVEFTGQSDKTWITLSSEHGTLLGERGLVGPRALLGGAVYVPMWVMPPQAAASHKEQETGDAEVTVSGCQLLSTCDFAATVCAIGGVDAPPGCVGRSVLPALNGQDVGADSVLSEYSGHLMLETMRHRVIYDVEADRPTALFDLINDPDERFDLVDSIEAWNVIDMLRLHLAGALMPLRPVRVA
jgi:arylsulfatase A-like enzyme